MNAEYVRLYLRWVGQSGSNTAEENEDWAPVFMECRECEREATHNVTHSKPAYCSDCAKLKGTPYKESMVQLIEKGRGTMHPLCRFPGNKKNVLRATEKNDGEVVLRQRTRPRYQDRGHYYLVPCADGKWQVSTVQHIILDEFQGSRNVIGLGRKVKAWEKLLGLLLVRRDGSRPLLHKTGTVFTEALNAEGIQAKYEPAGYDGTITHCKLEKDDGTVLDSSADEPLSANEPPHYMQDNMCYPSFTIAHTFTLVPERPEEVSKAMSMVKQYCTNDDSIVCQGKLHRMMSRSVELYKGVEEDVKKRLLVASFYLCIEAHGTDCFDLQRALKAFPFRDLEQEVDALEQFLEEKWEYQLVPTMLDQVGNKDCPANGILPPQLWYKNPNSNQGTIYHYTVIRVGDDSPAITGPCHLNRVSTGKRNGEPRYPPWWRRTTRRLNDALLSRGETALFDVGGHTMRVQESSTRNCARICARRAAAARNNIFDDALVACLRVGAQVVARSTTIDTMTMRVHSVKWTPGAIAPLGGEWTCLSREKAGPPSSHVHVEGGSPLLGAHTKEALRMIWTMLPETMSVSCSMPWYTTQDGKRCSYSFFDVSLLKYGVYLERRISGSSQKQAYENILQAARASKGSFLRDSPPYVGFFRTRAQTVVCHGAADIIKRCSKPSTQLETARLVQWKDMTGRLPPTRWVQEAEEPLPQYGLKDRYKGIYFAFVGLSDALCSRLTELVQEREGTVVPFKDDYGMEETIFERADERYSTNECVRVWADLPKGGKVGLPSSPPSRRGPQVRVKNCPVCDHTWEADETDVRPCPNRDCGFADVMWTERGCWARKVKFDDGTPSEVVPTANLWPMTVVVASVRERATHPERFAKLPDHVSVLCDDTFCKIYRNGDVEPFAGYKDVTKPWQASKKVDTEALFPNQDEPFCAGYELFKEYLPVGPAWTGVFGQSFVLYVQAGERFWVAQRRTTTVHKGDKFLTVGPRSLFRGYLMVIPQKDKLSVSLMGTTCLADAPRVCNATLDSFIDEVQAVRDGSRFCDTDDR